MNGDNGDRRESAGGDAFARVLLEALELRAAGAFDVEAFARKHPAHADRIRARLALIACLDPGEGVTWSTDAGDGRDGGDETRVGPYRLIEPLGRGGQGAVYRAEDTRLGRSVALKLLPGGAAATKPERLRFAREALAAARLAHPSICTVYEVGEADGIPFIAMELVDGEPLSRKLRATRESTGGGRRSTFVDLGSTRPGAERESGAAGEPESTQKRARSGETPRRKLAPLLGLIETVARALHATHEAGLIHRDVKPANLMITPDMKPVLVDFGLARFDEDGHPTLTRTGDVLGTPAYMSPEQVDGRSDRIDHRTDIYSLGAVLHECLTLHPPFERPTREGLYRAILTAEPPDPRQVNRDVPRDLKVVLQTALAKEPDRRYQTAAAFADDLRAVAEGRSVAVKPASAPRRLLRWTRRNPKSASVVALVFVVAILGSFLAARWRDLALGWAERERQAIETHLEKGFAKLASHDPTPALADFQAAADRSSAPLPEAVGGIALAHILAGKPEQSLEALAAVDPQAWPALARLRADALRKTGRNADADALERELPPGPTTAFGHYIMGWRTWLRALGGEDKALFRSAFDLFSNAILHSRRARALYYYEWARAAASADVDRETRRECADILIRNWPDRFMTWLRVGYLFRDDDAVRSAEALRHAIRLNPTSVGAHAELGRLLIREEGRVQEGIDLCRKAAALGPDYPESHQALAVGLTNTGEFDEAIEEFHAAIDLLEQDALPGRDMLAGLHLGLAGALEQRGSGREAMIEYEAAVRVCPNRAAGRFHLGRALHVRGEVKRAEAEYREAIRLDPNQARAHVNLGSILDAKGQLDRAIDHYRESIRLDPSIAVAHFNLGSALVDKGLLDPAIESYREAIRLKPDHADAHLALGAALCRKGELDEGIRSYREALRHEPGHVLARLCLGDELVEKGRLDRAIEAYEEVNRRKPDARAYFGLGRARTRTGDLEQAAQDYREAIRLRPDHAESHCNLGLVLEQQGKCLEALTWLRKGHAIGQKQPGWNYPSARWIARCETAVLGRIPEGIRLDSDDADAHAALGAALCRRGRLEEGLRYLRIALRLKPDEIEWRLDLGNALLKKGDLDEAIDVYEDVHRRAPDFRAWFGLGEARRRKGDYRNAADAYRESTRLRPSFAEAHCNRGLSLEHLGNHAEALSALREGHRLGRNRPDWRYASRDWIARNETALLREAREAARAGLGEAERVHLDPNRASDRSNAIERLRQLLSGWNADLAKNLEVPARIGPLTHDVFRDKVMRRLLDPTLVNRLPEVERPALRALQAEWRKLAERLGR